MKHFIFGRIESKILSAFLFIHFFMFTAISAFAAPASTEEAHTEAEERQSLPIQSNQIENWPAGPAIGAESAILLEANTGVILYAKNIHEKLYPASTTKLMTCLLAVENCELNDIVTFSHDSVFSLEPGSSNIGIDEGQAMTLEECLYGILTASANEVSNAVAEHVAGSMDAFAEMMNEKAGQLGCKNTHFVNAHGLHNENHYTSSYDLAVIAKAFFQNELLSKIGNTAYYHFIPTSKQPDDIIVRNKHKLISGEITYDGIKGGKTGYTDDARETLVTCAEQNGMKLICVIMKEESPEQFYDTVKLFDYGFTNFMIANVSENETKYSIQNSNFFNTSNDIFGNSKPILALNTDSYLIIPKSISFDELDSEISYDTTKEDTVAEINYFYHDAYLGTATVDFVREIPASYEFSQNAESLSESRSEESQIIIVNIKVILIVTLIIAAILIVIFIIRSIINSYSFLNNRGIVKKRGKRRKKDRKGGPYLPSSRLKDFDL